MTLAWDGSPGSPGTGPRPPNFPVATPGAGRREFATMRHGELVTRIGELAAQVGKEWAGYDDALALSYNPSSIRIRRKLPFRRGFPDLFIAGPGGVMHAELKCGDDTVSKDQRAWGARLTAAGQIWVIWEPIHLMTGRIETELAALCRVYPGRPAPG
jgi:hypothetical protein